MRVPYVDFMRGIAPRPQADPYVQRAIPLKDPDTGEPLDPQGQGLPLGTVPVNPIRDFMKGFENASAIQLQRKLIRKGLLPEAYGLQNMDGVQKVAASLAERQALIAQALAGPAESPADVAADVRKYYARPRRSK